MILICCFTRDTFAKYVNEQCFFVKFLIIGGITIGLLFVPNYNLRYYVTLSSYFSILFLVYQSIALVDFGYVWNEAWVRRHEDGRHFYGVLLVLTSIVLLLATAVALGNNFQNFWISGCTYNKINLLLNAVLIVVLLLLVLLKTHESSSILTALFVSLLFTYYNGAALSSFWVKECNNFTDATSRHGFMYDATFHIIVNLFCGSLAMITTSASQKISQNFEDAGISYSRNVQRPNLSLSVSNNQAEDDTNIKSFLEKEFRPSFTKYKSNHFILFHGVMMAFSVYLVMLFFDWRKVNIDFDKWAILTTANPSGFFIKTFNSVIIILLYIWTLLAPSIFRDREFDAY